MAGRILNCARVVAPVLALAALSRAEAQLLPPGSASLVDVAITSPKPGDRVAGAVAVTASVSGVGASSVTAVQFKLDGVNLGSADTTAPYETSWSSLSASDGWRTLTAVARNSTGMEVASAPVTVRLANVAAPPRPTQRYEDTSASYGLGWLPRSPNDWIAWSGGGAMQAMTPGAQATFTFTGPSVAWVGYRSLDSGIARILVDGFFVAEVDLFARREEARTRVFTVGGLTDTSHTLTIEVTGRRNAESSLPNVVVDAFDVSPTPVSRQQETNSGVSTTSGWTADASLPWSATGALISAAPGAQASLTFRGTAIDWLGYRGPDGGIARVFLDGALAAEVDTYSPQPRIQGATFVAAGLAANVQHTLTIESTGNKNAASTGASVVVDAFEITSPGERFEETEWAVTYSGAWTLNNFNKSFSGGTSAVTLGGARTTFRFSGTGVSWIGARAERTGLAHVFLDGAYLTTVDTYSPRGEGFQETLFSATGLLNGAHTLAIEATGTKNPAATNTYIVVDAFDVVR